MRTHQCFLLFSGSVLLSAEARCDLDSCRLYDNRLEGVMLEPMCDAVLHKCEAHSNQKGGVAVVDSSIHMVRAHCATTGTTGNCWRARESSGRRRWPARLAR